MITRRAMRGVVVGQRRCNTFMNYFKSDTDADTAVPLLQELGESFPRVFLDFEAGRGNPLGRVVIELNGDLLPKATENFLALCTGEYATIGNAQPRRKRSLKVGNLHYLNTNVHRVLPGFLIQGGDNEHFDGTGGWCTFPGMKYFEDESYDIPFDKPGIVGMATSAPNLNASQFFITTAPAEHLRRKCIAIGTVVEGMEVVHAIEKEKLDHNDCPIRHIRISGCGQA